MPPYFELKLEVYSFLMTEPSVPTHAKLVKSISKAVGKTWARALKDNENVVRLASNYIVVRPRSNENVVRPISLKNVVVALIIILYLPVQWNYVDLKVSLKYF